MSNECAWCWSNPHPPGVVWKASLQNWDGDKKVSSQEIGYIYCTYCQDGVDLAKEEALRKLLRNGS